MTEPDPQAAAFKRPIKAGVQLMKNRSHLSPRLSALFALGLSVAMTADSLSAQTSATPGTDLAPLNWTTQQDHQNMKEQLGIIGLVNKGQPRKPDDWGSLRAWAWGAARGLDYLETDSTVNAKKVGDLPVDAHELIALCAPRPTFISYGIPERGDAQWLDQQGSYMATVAAGPVFRLLGARDLGDKDDYRVAKMPPVNADRLDGELAWRQHDGGHEDRSNMKHFIAWASKWIEHPSPAQAATTR